MLNFAYILIILGFLCFIGLFIFIYLDHRQRNTDKLVLTHDLSTKILSHVERLDKNLVNPISRGQFGEKIAEDVLKYLNLKEGIHYDKQKSNDLNRPDFTFKLSSGCVLNMDSKFPLNNYLKYCEASEEGRKQYLTTFLKDVRDRIKEAAIYVNPVENTLNFVLVFIPSDSLLQFILEHDKGLMDYCLSNRVVLCSPWTLYSVLSVVLSIESFINLDKQVIIRTEQMRGFYGEWQNYKDTIDKMKKSIEKVNGIMGELDNVRKNKMDKWLAGV